MRITMTLTSAIWTHPMMVIRKLLEPLWVDQRIDEIDHDDDGHDRAEDVIEKHCRLTFFRRRARRGSKRRRSRRRLRAEPHQAWRLPQASREIRAPQGQNPKWREHLAYPRVIPLGCARFSSPSRVARDQVHFHALSFEAHRCVPT